MYPESCHNVTFFFYFKKTFCQSSTSYFVLMDLLNFFFLLIMCNICMTSYQQQLFIQFRQNLHISVYIIFIPVDYLLIGEKSCKSFRGIIYGTFVALCSHVTFSFNGYLHVRRKQTSLF